MIEIHKTLDGYVIKIGPALLLFTDEYELFDFVQTELYDVIVAQPVTAPSGSRDFTQWESTLG